MRLLVPADTATLRRNNFDAIRLTMALLVVWSHSFALWFGDERDEWLSRLTAGVYNSGNIGVLAFFAISGFLITLSWERSAGAIAYLKRRVLRIYPGYLVAITLCSLVIVPAFSSRHFGYLTPAEWRGMVGNLLLRNYIIPSDAFHGSAVNGSLWSIPYEFWCYLGVLALGMAGLIRWRAIYPLLAVAVILVRAWLDMTGRRPAGGMLEPIIGFAYFWFNVLPPFLLGGAAWLFRDRLPRSGWLAMALIVATIAVSHLPLADPLRTVITRTLLPPTLVYGVLYLAFEPRIPAHGAASFGDFSYGCYLYAFPIQRMLAASLKGVIPFWSFVLLAMLLSLTAGVASWYLVERWFLPRARRQHDRKRNSLPLQEEAAIVAP
ncbi:acyltransferase family protein [Sphingomonas sp. MMS24-J13]|uniref:acyltransferase family protein n=1 Tax=Sphingomonas sp. MMS24-J13 TaxID=3238686 RepID=UPI00384D3D12